MGLLDNLRDRLTGGYDDYDDDDYYDDEYDDEDYDDAPQGSGILGNTSRPEAESVAVYTRSGRPVGSNAGAPTAGPTARSSARPSGGYPSSYRRNRNDYDEGFDDQAPSGTYNPSPSAGLNSSRQLPPYVLVAEEYEDVQTVVRRVRTNQPVLLVLNETPADIAQRILDFSFGLAFGIGGEVQPVDAKAFLVLPADIQVSDAEIDRLLSQAR